MNEKKELEKQILFLTKEYEKLQLDFIFLQDGYKKIFSENLNIKAKMRTFKTRISKLERDRVSCDELIKILDQLD